MNFKTLTKWYVAMLVLTVSYSIKAASLTQSQRAEISADEAQEIMHEINEKRQKLNYNNAKTAEFVKLANAIPESTNEELQQLKRDIVEQVTKFSSHHERQTSNAQRISLSQNQKVYSVAELEARYKNIGEQTYHWKLDALLEDIHKTEAQTQDKNELELLRKLAKSIGDLIIEHAEAHREHFSKKVNKTRMRTPKEKRAAEAKRAEAKDETEAVNTGSGTLKSNGTDTTHLRKLITKGSQTMLPLSYLTAKATLKKAPEPRQVTTQASSSSRTTASGTLTPKNNNTLNRAMFPIKTTPIEQFEKRLQEIKQLYIRFGLDSLLADMQKEKDADIKKAEDDVSAKALRARYEAAEKEITSLQAAQTRVPLHRQRQQFNNRPSIQFDPKAEIPIATKESESETTKLERRYIPLGEIDFTQHDEQ